jgi:branched-chain amino acid transport system permease protein
VFGPLVGALVVKALGEAATTVAGDAPGLNLIVYGCVLVLVIAFAPRGLIGLVTGIQRRFARTRRGVAHG